MGRHAMPDPESTVWIVSTVDTHDGPKPAVLATHPLIAQRLVELLEAIADTTLTDQDWTNAVYAAFDRYRNVPGEIVLSEAEMVEAEVVNEG